MKLYLSSYKFGDHPEELAKLFGKNKKVAVITNALDFSTDIERRKTSEQNQIQQLIQLGLDPELLDLRDYFNNKRYIEEKLKSFGGVWVHGGNSFLLRVAYKLSGFDEIVKSYVNDADKKEFVYAGFSAGCCVLQKSLKGIEFVDDQTLTKSVYKIETIWEGVGIIDFVFVPHFESDHHESEVTNHEVEYYKKNNIKYKTLHDGEVLILNTDELN